MGMGMDTKPGLLVVDQLGLDIDAQDLNTIASIQSELAVAAALLAAGVRESSTGFLISAYKAEDFRDFIRRGGIILGARQTEQGPLIGYLLGNSGQTFLANHPTTPLLWDDAQSEKKYGPLYSSGDFTYLDQIGIAQSFHGTGVARQLLCAVSLQLGGLRIQRHPELSLLVR